jgi:hypothetical protein
MHHLCCAGQKIMLWVYCGTPAIVGIPFMWWMVAREEKDRVSDSNESSEATAGTVADGAKRRTSRALRSLLIFLAVDCSS